MKRGVGFGGPGLAKPFSGVGPKTTSAYQLGANVRVIRRNRMRKIGLFLAVFVLIATVYTPSANAERSFFTCKVIATGMSIGGALMLQLTHVSSSPVFSNKWFVTIDSTKKEMLATALTAVSTGDNILVAVDPTEAGFPVIDTVFIVATN